MRIPIEKNFIHRDNSASNLSVAKMAISSVLKKLEVKPTDDEWESIETSRWGNRDIYPIPHDKRTYGVYAYVSYWGTFFLTLHSSVCARF